MANRTQTAITLPEAYRRAEAALTGGDPLRAIALTQHILRFYPHYLDAYRLLGEAYFERAHAEEALRFFSHVLAADPQNVPARVGRAIIADERGQVDLAIAEYEQAFEIDPSIAEVRGELLRLYQTRYGSAGATIRLTPSGLAYVHLRAGLREAAISELGYVAQLRPDRWDIEVALAEALWRNEQLDEAAAVAGDILAGHPACVKCCWMLGYLHWTAGRTDSGRRYLMEAVALDPTYRIAQALWEATPWPLNRAVARVQPAPIPAPSPYDLVGADMDLTLSLPAFLDVPEPVAVPAEPVGAVEDAFGGPSPLLPDAAGDAFGGPSPLLPDAAGDAFGGPSPLLPDAAGDAAAESLLGDDGFMMLPAAAALETPVSAEPPALDLDWFDDWASAAAVPPALVAVAAQADAAPESTPEDRLELVPTDPAELWAQFIAPGGSGEVWSEYPVPVPPVALPDAAPVGAPDAAPDAAQAVQAPDAAPDAVQAVQAPLFAEAATSSSPPPSMPDGTALDLLLPSAAVPEAWQLPLDLPPLAPPPNPAQLALDLPEPGLPSSTEALSAAEPAGNAPRVAPVGGSAVAPTPDLPTMRIENLSNDALLDWLLQVQPPLTEATAPAMPHESAALPVAARVEEAITEAEATEASAPPNAPVVAVVEPDHAESGAPSDLAAVAAEEPELTEAVALPDAPVVAAAEPAAAAAVMPPDPIAAEDRAGPAMSSADLAVTDVTAFSEDDLLDWLIHQTPTLDPGANGSSAVMPPVAPPADLQALDSATIATLTADDLLDWLTVAAPLTAEKVASAPIAGPNGSELAHNTGEVSYNHRVLTGEVGYNQSAPDGVPDWLQQRPPGAPDSD